MQYIEDLRSPSKSVHLGSKEFQQKSKIISSNNVRQNNNFRNPICSSSSHNQRSKQRILSMDPRNIMANKDDRASCRKVNHHKIGLNIQSPIKYRDSKHSQQSFNMMNSPGNYRNFPQGFNNPNHGLM